MKGLLGLVSLLVVGRRLAAPRACLGQRFLQEKHPHSYSIVIWVLAMNDHLTIKQKWIVKSAEWLNYRQKYYLSIATVSNNATEEYTKRHHIRLLNTRYYGSFSVAIGKVVIKQTMFDLDLEVM